MPCKRTKFRFCGVDLFYSWFIDALLSPVLGPMLIGLEGKTKVGSFSVNEGYEKASKLFKAY